MSGIEFTYEAVVMSHQMLLRYIGADWFQENIASLKNEKTAGKFSQDAYFDLQSIHPLIEWCLLFSNWKAEVAQLDSTELPGDIVNLALLGQSLHVISDHQKFDKLITRLKSEKEFFSTAFEIEVAAAYIVQGWKVDFIDEEDIPTPDLFVTVGKGTAFWVECKNRDGSNSVDKRTGVLWKQVEHYLLDYLKQHSLNYQVVISAKKELQNNDVPYLRKLVIDSIEHKFEPRHLLRLPGASVTVADDTNNFGLTIYKLSEPDVNLDGKSFEWPFPRYYSAYGTFTCERKDMTGGGIRIRNPRAIQFRPLGSSNRIQSVKDAFRSAARQLPASGPGVIHIRLPINSWVKDLDETKRYIEHYLGTELSGRHNRRVNAVIVSVYYLELVQHGAFQYPIYKPITIFSEHKNPKVPIVMSS